LIARARALIPPARRERADSFGRLMYNTFGNYFGGSVTVAAMSGMWTLTIALIFDVPLAPVAAIWSMVTNVIPQIGGFLGGSFVTVLALSVSVPTAIAVCVLFVAYMNFENNVIQPANIGNAVDLSPPVSMLAVLIGGAAGGIPGALVATPIVGSAKRIYFVVRGRPEAEPEPKPSLKDRISGLFRRSSAKTAAEPAAS
jgi:predicted PurR-regulated permease PerM